MHLYVIPRKFIFIRKSHFPGHWKNWWIVSSYYSKSANISRKTLITFESMVRKRRDEAEKSHIIEEKNFQFLPKHFGNVKRVFNFKTSMKVNMCLIEFEKKQSSKEFHRILQQKTSERSTFNRKRQSQHSNARGVDATAVKISEANVDYMIHNCANISEQMQYFYETQKMTEVGTRLRFITCHKVELCVSNGFSHCQVLPFGSSVNSFGSQYSDLDMCVTFSPRKNEQQRDCGRRIQLDRNCSLQQKRLLRTIWRLLPRYLSDVENRLLILTAKIPIIKYRDPIFDLECDITLENESALSMSQVLYLLGCADPRVCPFVSCVRWWARQKQLTRKWMPGKWFSSFTITLLALFFLMNTKGAPILPSLRTLLKISSIGKGISYPCIRNVSHMPASTNRQTLENLLEGFFLFYATFDFSREGISLITGRTFRNLCCPLYLQNPVDKELNVAKNTTETEIQFLQKTFSEAVNALEEYYKEKNSFHTPWGFLELCSIDPATIDQARS